MGRVNVRKKVNTVTNEAFFPSPEGRTPSTNYEFKRGKCKGKDFPLHYKQALTAGRPTALHILDPGARRR